MTRRKQKNKFKLKLKHGAVKLRCSVVGKHAIKALSGAKPRVPWVLILVVVMWYGQLQGGPVGKEGPRTVLIHVGLSVC